MDAHLLKKLIDWILAVTAAQSISAKRTITTDGGQYRITIERIDEKT